MGNEIVYSNTKNILITGGAAIAIGWIAYAALKLFGVMHPPTINAVCLTVCALAWPVMWWRYTKDPN